MRFVLLVASILLLPSLALAQAPVTPRACGGVTTVATGNTAVSPLSTGPVNGGYLYNPLSATDQGIVTAEAIIVDPTGTAGTAGNGTAVSLSPGTPWYFPAGTNLATLSVNAATSGHKFVCARW